MSRYSERAVVRDADLMANFRQGFEEGLASAAEQLVFVVQLVFDGTELNAKTFSDLDAALDFMLEHLRHGAGAQARITCRRSGPGEATEVAPAIEEGIVEGEIVE
jgi:hypothetical protein